MRNCDIRPRRNTSLSGNSASCETGASGTAAAPERHQVKQEHQGLRHHGALPEQLHHRKQRPVRQGLQELQERLRPQEQHQVKQEHQGLRHHGALPEQLSHRKQRPVRQGLQELPERLRPQEQHQ